MYIYLLFFFVSLLSSTVGSLCDIGGGVFMKPALDALDLFPVNTITFLSMCTVLSMSGYNVLFSKKGRV